MMTQEIRDAAQIIRAELVAICTARELALFAIDESGNRDLRMHEQLVATRLGGDYVPAAWDEAMSLLQAQAQEFCDAAGI